MVRILKPYSSPLEIDSNYQPQVVLVCGINGVGKTSNIVKMVYMLNKFGWKIAVTTCDTFRAAVINQMGIGLNKYASDDSIFIAPRDQDESIKSIVCRAYDTAKVQNCDVLLIDTAGRLHNNANLMHKSIS